MSDGPLLGPSRSRGVVRRRGMRDARRPGARASPGTARACAGPPRARARGVRCDDRARAPEAAAHDAQGAGGRSVAPCHGDAGRYAAPPCPVPMPVARVRGRSTCCVNALPPWTARTASWRSRARAGRRAQDPHGRALRRYVRACLTLRSCKSRVVEQVHARLAVCDPRRASGKRWAAARRPWGRCA
jgi:hypothetical protein